MRAPLLTGGDMRIGFLMFGGFGAKGSYVADGETESDEGPLLLPNAGTADRRCKDPSPAWRSTLQGGKRGEKKN